MARQINFSEIEDLGLTIAFNKQYFHSPQDVKYYPVIIHLQGRVIGENNITFNLNQPLLLGTPRKEEFTNKEVFKEIKKEFGLKISSKIKQAFIDLVGQDLDEAEG